MIILVLHTVLVVVMVVLVMTMIVLDTTIPAVTCRHGTCAYNRQAVTLYVTKGNQKRQLVCRWLQPVEREEISVVEL